MRYRPQSFMASAGSLSSANHVPFPCASSESQPTPTCWGTENQRGKPRRATDVSGRAGTLPVSYDSMSGAMKPNVPSGDVPQPP